MKIVRIEELQIDERTHLFIQDLLQHCFPEYPKGRSYYKQIPTFRYLVWDKKKLVAQMAVEHRMMNVGSDSHRIFGIADLCVHTDYQKKHIATDLVTALEKLGKKNRIDFLVLTAGEHDFYNKLKFKLQQTTCRWLMINEHQTLGVGHRRIDESLMVKAINGKAWGTGLVDFLGHVF